nr:MAG TPA: hypothetical protein [Caudoviricetes sp.]
MEISIQTIKERHMYTKAFFPVFLGSFVFFAKDNQRSF